MADETGARALWRHFEAIHAVTYFAEESRSAAAEAGLKGFWMGYFGFRAAPMGPVAQEGLRSDGVLAGDGSLTADGAARKRRVEDRTDRLAARPWAAIGDRVRPWNRISPC